MIHVMGNGKYLDEMSKGAAPMKSRRIYSPMLLLPRVPLFSSILMLPQTGISIIPASTATVMSDLRLKLVAMSPLT